MNRSTNQHFGQKPTIAVYRGDRRCSRCGDPAHYGEWPGRASGEPERVYCDGCLFKPVNRQTSLTE